MSGDALERGVAVNSLQLFGVLLFSAGIIILALYGFYAFAIAEMPLIIKLPLLLIAAGCMVVLVSLVAERVSEVRKEKIKKEAKK